MADDLNAVLLKWRMDSSVFYGYWLGEVRIGSVHRAKGTGSWTGRAFIGREDAFAFAPFGRNERDFIAAQHWVETSAAQLLHRMMANQRKIDGQHAFNVVEAAVSSVWSQLHSEGASDKLISTVEDALCQILAITSAVWLAGREVPPIGK